MYMLRPKLQTDFGHSDETPDHATYNKAMSAIRVSVECNYKYLKQIWDKNDFARLHRVRRFPNWSTPHFLPYLYLTLRIALRGKYKKELQIHSSKLRVILQFIKHIAKSRGTIKIKKSCGCPSSRGLCPSAA